MDDASANDAWNEHAEIRDSVARLCAGFPGEYWRKLDAERGYPTEVVTALTQAGYLSVLIPEEYGGSGLGLSEAAAILGTIQARGCNGAACHAQMYVMGTILRHGSDAQKSRYLPKIATGDLRLQAFGVTEPGSGSDTTSLRTFARRDGERYVVNGSKVWTSRAEHSDLMLLLARTTPREQTARKTEGLSAFIVDMRAALGRGLTIRPIRTMMNHNSCEVFFEDMEVPAENLLGEEGRGFRYILDGINAERLLVAAECVGDAKWFAARSVAYANERTVFGRKIGQNQGVQFPISRAYDQMRAAEALVREGCARFDAGLPCGEQANIAKMLAAEASWAAGEAQIHDRRNERQRGVPDRPGRSGLLARGWRAGGVQKLRASQPSIRCGRRGSGQRLERPPSTGVRQAPDHPAPLEHERRIADGIVGSRKVSSGSLREPRQVPAFQESWSNREPFRLLAAS